MISTDDYKLNKMLPAELDALWNSIQHVYEDHFSSTFAGEYLTKKIEDAHFGRLRVIRDNGKAVGLLMLFGHKKIIEGKPIIIYQSSAAIYRAYRNKSNMVVFLYSKIAFQSIKHLFSEQYVIAGLIHPSSFTITYKTLAKVYPTIENEVPEKISKLLESLKKSGFFSTKQFDFENPFVARYNYPVVQTEKENESWKKKLKHDKFIQFYHDSGAMPSDRTLICIVPFTLKNLSLSLIKTARNKLKKK